MTENEKNFWLDGEDGLKPYLRLKDKGMPQGKIEQIAWLLLNGSGCGFCKVCRDNPCEIKDAEGCTGNIAKYIKETVLNEVESELNQYQAIGTVEEIKELLQIISEVQDDVDESGISTGLLNTLLEYAEYAKIGTVEECREAMGKQISKKYEIIHPCKGVSYYKCPYCDGLLHISENFCGECGQAIDWSE